MRTVRLALLAALVGGAISFGIAYPVRFVAMTIQHGGVF